MKKNILYSFILMVIVAITRFFITFFIARHWPKGDVGCFNLIISLSFLLSVFGLMGQNLGIVRFFSTKELKEYSWKKYMTDLCLKGIAIAFVGSVVATLVYKFGIIFLVSCFIITSCVLVQEYCSAFFRARQRYYISLIVGQFMPVVFMIALLAFAISKFPPLNVILLIYMSFGVIYTVICVYFTFSVLPSGAAVIPSDVKKKGYLLFGLGVTFILVNHADVMLVAGLVNVEALATYTVTLSIMRLYDFGGMSLNHVLLPKIKTMPGSRLKQMWVYIILVGFAITTFYFMFGKEAVQFLYKGKYNEGLVLIPFFCVVGFLKLMYILPSSFIAAVSSEIILKRFLYVNIVAVILNYTTNIYLISHIGIEGAALGAAVAWFMRVLGAYFLTRNVIFLPKQAEAAMELQ